MNQRLESIIFRLLLSYCLFTALLGTRDIAQGQEAEVGSSSIAEPFLVSGKLADGEAKLKSLLEKTPDNDQLLMELGFVQFFRSVEQMGQTLHSFGPRDSLIMGQIPFLRFPVPANSDPKPVELADVRRMVQKFIRDLDQVDATLAKVSAEDVSMPIRIMQVRLDFNSDGTASEKELLGPVLLSYLGGARRTQAQLESLAEKSIRFDRADVDWLRGYCCLLRSMGEVFLAHDETEFWNVVAHRLFKKGKTEFEFLDEEANPDGDFYFEIADIIAAIHNVRFPVSEPERLKAAHRHLLNTIGHSRAMWKRINAETDDDGEWIPSPDQSNPFTEVRITRRMTDSWESFLNEGEKILNGELLVPFWRGTNKKRGIDLRQVFHDPKEFDLVLWIHGSGARQFIRIGECSKPETWSEFQRVFRGDFFGFAIWFN